MGKLLNALKNYPRFTYRGSLTTPPCSETLNWNVINYVFPIKQEHLDQFKAQLRRQDKYDLEKLGNWRVINSINEHQPMIVTQQGGIYHDSTTGRNVSIIFACLFAILTVMFCASTLLYWFASTTPEPVQQDYDTNRSTASKAAVYEVNVAPTPVDN